LILDLIAAHVRYGQYMDAAGAKIIENPQDLRDRATQAPESLFRDRSVDHGYY
jgi:hypothetical protein